MLLSELLAILVQVEHTRQEAASNCFSAFLNILEEAVINPTPGIQLAGLIEHIGHGLSLSGLSACIRQPSGNLRWDGFEGVLENAISSHHITHQVVGPALYTLLVVVPVSGGLF